MNSKKTNESFFIKRMFLLCVIFELMVMIISCYSKNDSVIIVYGNFTIALCAILLTVIANKFRISFLKKIEAVQIIGFGFVQILMYMLNSLKYDTIFFDIHKLFMCLGMMFACFYVSQKYSCSNKLFNKIIDVVLIFGIIVTIYNFWVNLSYFKLGNLTQIMIYSWNFKGFFPARAAYGTFVSICAIIALFRFEERRRIWWIAICIWLVLNVLITAARAQCIAVIIAISIYLVRSKKYRKYLILGCAILILLLLILNEDFFTNITSTYYMFFDHTYGRNTDISTGRLTLWFTALKNMDPLNWLVGNGIGSKDMIMEIRGVTILNERLLSFHSGYIDLLFETGIAGYCLWGSIICKTIQRVNSFCPEKIKHLFGSIAAVILVSCLFDSCYLIFTTDTMSLFATFIMICFPITVSSYYKNLEGAVI